MVEYKINKIVYAEKLDRAFHTFLNCHNPLWTRYVCVDWIIVLEQDSVLVE